MNTLKEILDHILHKMHPTNTNYLKNTHEDDLIMFHHTLGRNIRNTFKLWESNPELLANMCLPLDIHPDEISQKIIEALWRKLNNK